MVTMAVFLFEEAEMLDQLQTYSSQALNRRFTLQ